MPEQPAGRLSAGETGTETETDVSPQCLAAVADPGVVPLFPSRPSQPTLWVAPPSIYRLAFPSPGLGVMPSSKPTPAVALPGLDTAASYLRSLGVLVFWALQEACHR